MVHQLVSSGVWCSRRAPSTLFLPFAILLGILSVGRGLATGHHARVAEPRPAVNLNIYN